MMKLKKTHRFPFNDSGHLYTKAQSTDTVFIDGMKVLFDKRVGLSPVKLEKKTDQEIPKGYE